VGIAAEIAKHLLGPAKQSIRILPISRVKR
jgi:hypothetical protein